MGLVDDIAANCLAMRVRKLNRVVTNIYDDALRPLGLKASQMNILVVAAKMGLARPGDISRTLEIDASTLSRNLERMRKRGWIEALEDERDARSQPFRVTAKGADLIAAAYPAWQTAQARAAEALGGEAVAALRSAPPASLGPEDG